MTWDTIIMLALLIIACIYCIRKLIIKKSACTSCASKRSCSEYYNPKTIITKCTIQNEKDKE